MSHKFLITISILILQILYPQPSLAAPIFHEDFENSAGLIQYIQFIPLKGEVGISPEIKYSGESSLHMKSTNREDPTVIEIPLNLEFDKNTTISWHHYFMAGIPYYWIIVEGDNGEISNIEIDLEYGNPGTLWYTDSIVYVREFGLENEQWAEFSINVYDDLNLVLSDPLSPWDSFTPTKIRSIVIGLNPIWEPFTERNIYIDSLVVGDGNEIINSPNEIIDDGNNLPTTDLILPQIGQRPNIRKPLKTSAKFQLYKHLKIILQ